MPKTEAVALIFSTPVIIRGLGERRVLLFQPASRLENIMRLAEIVPKSGFDKNVSLRVTQFKLTREASGFVPRMQAMLCKTDPNPARRVFIIVDGSIRFLPGRCAHRFDGLLRCGVEALFGVITAASRIHHQCHARKHTVLVHSAPLCKQRVPDPGPGTFALEQFFCIADEGRTQFPAERSGLFRPWAVGIDLSPEQAHIGIVGITNIERHIDIETGKIRVGIEQIDQIALANHIVLLRDTKRDCGQILRPAIGQFL